MDRRLGGRPAFTTDCRLGRGRNHPAPTFSHATIPVENCGPGPVQREPGRPPRFKNQLGLSLAAGERFADEQHRLRYCFQLLKGETLTTVEPFLGPLGYIKFCFLQELTRIFGDSNEEATAARKLEGLRQGNWEFTRYYADFTRPVTTLEHNDG